MDGTEDANRCQGREEESLASDVRWPSVLWAESARSYDTSLWSLSGIPACTVLPALWPLCVNHPRLWNQEVSLVQLLTYPVSNPSPFLKKCVLTLFHLFLKSNNSFGDIGVFWSLMACSFIIGNFSSKSSHRWLSHLIFPRLQIQKLY